ncbi:MAG: NAD-dependent epimerase/dehydratase family protein, partial [Gammaproteobacteria bacterium]
PLLVGKALAGEPMPIYGTGENVRDWLYVGDHVQALVRVLEAGEVGACYNIGGGHESSNLELARLLCAELDRLHPEGAPHERLITFVEDRPGHDFRYAIDSSRIADRLGWRAQMPFSEGLRRTIQWYLENREWMEKVTEQSDAGQRLGLAR